MTIDLWEVSLVTFPMQERARLFAGVASGGFGGPAARPDSDRLRGLTSELF